MFSVNWDERRYDTPTSKRCKRDGSHLGAGCHMPVRLPRMWLCDIYLNAERVVATRWAVFVKLFVPG